MTIRVLAEKGASHCAIGRTLAVSEGTVRYHLRRAAAAAGAGDGRRRQRHRAEGEDEAIRVWMEARAEGERPPNVRELYEHLVAEHAYGGSYNSVRRYVRAHYPRLLIQGPPGPATYCSISLRG